MSSNDGTRLQGNRLKMKNLFLVISLISIDQSRWIYQLLMNHIVMMLTENCSQRIQFVLASLKVEKTHAMETKVGHLFAMIKCRVLLAGAMVVPSRRSLTCIQEFVSILIGSRKLSNGTDSVLIHFIMFKSNK